MSHGPKICWVFAPRLMCPQLKPDICIGWVCWGVAMRRSLIAVVAASISVLSQNALGADLPRKAPAAPPPPPPFSWTGFYVGIHAGGAWTSGDSNFNPLPDPVSWNRSPETFDLSRSSGLVGVHLGYNWQFAPQWVVGIEGDWSWTNNSTSEFVNTRNSAGVAFAPASPAVMSRDLDWLASIRARLGFLVTPNLFLYGTGGAAFGHVNYNATLSSVPPGTVWAVDFDKTGTGWVVGGGVEWHWASNWLLRAEYLFYRLPSETAIATGNPNNFPGFTIQYNWNDIDVNVVRAGLSYKF